MLPATAGRLLGGVGAVLQAQQDIQRRHGASAPRPRRRRSRRPPDTGSRRPPRCRAADHCPTSHSVTGAPPNATTTTSAGSTSPVARRTPVTRPFADGQSGDAEPKPQVDARSPRAASPATPPPAARTDTAAAPPAARPSSPRAPSFRAVAAISAPSTPSPTTTTRGPAPPAPSAARAASSSVRSTWTPASPSWPGSVRGRRPVAITMASAVRTAPELGAHRPFGNVKSRRPDRRGRTSASELASIVVRAAAGCAPRPSRRRGPAWTAAAGRTAGAPRRRAR